jgi:hypothetical protein
MVLAIVSILDLTWTVSQSLTFDFEPFDKLLSFRLAPSAKAVIYVTLNKFNHVSIFAKNSCASKTSLSASRASRNGELFGNFADTNAFSGRMSILNSV